MSLVVSCQAAVPNQPKLHHAGKTSYQQLGGPRSQRHPLLSRPPPSDLAPSCSAGPRQHPWSQSHFRQPWTELIFALSSLQEVFWAWVEHLLREPYSLLSL